MTNFMKKYTKYILILLLLMGYFSIFSKTNAQEPRGNCYSDGKTLSNYTQTACKNNSSGAVWDDPSAPRGGCLSNGTFYQNWTQIACTHHSNGAVWTSASANFYNFLAPLPDPNSNGQMQTTFDPTDPNALGNYLNLIIKLIIGFSAVMAVVMIVMGGLEYMTGELVSEKASGKEKITGAVFGLVLVLGSWLLLNEINPDLLNSNLKIDTATVVVEIQEDHESINDPISNATPPTGAIANCTEGIVKEGPSWISVCKSINTNVNAMFTKAKTDNIPLSGGGFRSQSEQIQKRIQNCGAENVYKKEAKCKVQTATPGSSMHESGLALDLQCNGSKIKKDDVCFKWLQQNASTYKLFNLATGDEPWHWSTNGR
jgi:type IV secretory pathway VirB2 component (pilin)